MCYWSSAWCGKPQFFGVRARAANIGQGEGDYTLSQFQEDFPQFFTSEGAPLLPAAMLGEIINMANSSIAPDKWGSSWRYAAGLYVAHYATTMLRAYAPSSETPAQAAASGQLVGVVKSATLGDASVSYDTSAITAGTEDWGDLNATTYGQMLASRARLIGMAGMAVI